MTKTLTLTAVMWHKTIHQNKHTTNGRQTFESRNNCAFENNHKSFCSWFCRKIQMKMKLKETPSETHTQTHKKMFWNIRIRQIVFTFDDCWNILIFRRYFHSYGFNFRVKVFLFCCESILCFELILRIRQILMPFEMFVCAFDVVSVRDDVWPPSSFIFNFNQL